jgi:hypothetical protein
MTEVNESPLLESIRQCAQTLAEEAQRDHRIEVAKILNAIAQLVYNLRLKEEVLG